LVLFADPGLLDWMKQFFSRLDFTQFTSTTRPFNVVPFIPGAEVHMDTSVRSRVALAATLVNIESASW
jgi:hypothetical protein